MPLEITASPGEIVHAGCSSFSCVRSVQSDVLWALRDEDTEREWPTTGSRRDRSFTGNSASVTGSIL